MSAGCVFGYGPAGGNPLYRWERHKENGYAWWLARMEYSFRLYDVVRWIISADLMPTIRFRQKTKPRSLATGRRAGLWPL